MSVYLSIQVLCFLVLASACVINGNSVADRSDAGIQFLNRINLIVELDDFVIILISFPWEIKKTK
jgi:hypothetical protein